VIGISGATMSRIRSTTGRSIPDEGRRARAIFLRMYRSLSALLGDPASCRAWFDADNEHLGGTPAELMRSVEGLVRAAEYLEAMRGKV
jgi:hypothetical protein